MKAIVVGAGEVGYHIADRLSRERHDVTIIEQSAERGAALREKLNALVITGSGASPETLERADIAETELFIAVTDLDEVNLVACLLANEYEVPRKIARTRSLQYSQADGKLNAAKLGIDLLINPQAVVAGDICRLVTHGAATGVAEFAGGRVLFLGYQVPEGSPLANASLRDLGAICGADIYRLLVTAVTRGDDTVIPRGDDVLQAGDTVHFVCRPSELQAVRYLFGLSTAEEARRIFVLGGGRVGQRVAAALGEQRFRVSIVERDPDRCLELASELEHLQVLQASGTDLDALVQEGLAEADVAIAVTDDDKTNILSSLLAKKAGTRRAVALVNEPAFLTLAPSLGVDACISPRLATAAAILKYVRGGAVESLAMLEMGSAEVLELVIPSDNPRLGQPLKTLRVPDHSIVASIVRGTEVIIPRGDDHLEGGDHVIIFALPDAVRKVERFFGP